jgi:hypothetical protein
MQRILFFLLLIASGAALAGTDAQDKLNRLEAALDGVRQEQQAAYQNYRMTRELRWMEVQEGLPPKAQHPYGTDLNTPPPDYDDVLRTQQERERRIRQYTDDLKELSARYIELEKERKALAGQIGELRRQLGE